MAEEQTVEGLEAAFGTPTIANSASKLELAHVPGNGVANYANRVSPGLSTAWRDTGTGGAEASHTHELGFNNDGTPVLAQQSGTALYAWVDVTITAKAEGADDSLGNHYSQSKIAQDLDEKWVTVTFTSTDSVRLFTAADVTTTSLLDKCLTTDANSAMSKTVVVQLDNLDSTGVSARIYYFVNGETLYGAEASGTNITAGGITASVSASRLTQAE